MPNSSARINAIFLQIIRENADAEGRVKSPARFFAQAGYKKRESGRSCVTRLCRQGELKRLKKGEFLVITKNIPVGPQPNADSGQEPTNTAQKTQQAMKPQRSKSFQLLADYCRQHADENGEFEVPRTHYEKFGYKSPNVVSAAMKHLMKKGIAERIPGKKAWYRLISATPDTATKNPASPTLNKDDDASGQKMTRKETTPAILEKYLYLTSEEKTTFNFLNTANRLVDNEVRVTEKEIRDSGPFGETNDAAFKSFLRKMADRNILTSVGQGEKGRIFVLNVESYLHWSGLAKPRIDADSPLTKLANELADVQTHLSKLSEAVQETERTVNGINYTLRELQREEEKFRRRLDEIKKEKNTSLANLSTYKKELAKAMDELRSSGLEQRAQDLNHQLEMAGHLAKLSDAAKDEFLARYGK